MRKLAAKLNLAELRRFAPARDWAIFGSCSRNGMVRFLFWNSNYAAPERCEQIPHLALVTQVMPDNQLPLPEKLPLR